MHSSARALAWEFRQHQWGLLAVGAYAVALTAMWLVDLWRGPVADPGVARFVGTVSIPLSVAAFYLLALFTFGFTGDLAARQSMYPTRLFTLPVTSAALAGWPMAYGTICMALLALAARLAPWPAGVRVPLWAALFAAVVLAWMQALTWTAYPLRGLRVAAAVGWLTVMDVVLVVGIELEPAEWLMAAMLAPQLPLAHVAARAAVARARRGDVPEWRGPVVALRRVTDALRHRRRPFATPIEAQRWNEWRQHGWSLPVWVAIVLPFAAALPWIDRHTPGFVLIALIVMLLTPVVMAAFVGVTLARAGHAGPEAHGVSPFLATRPLTSAALVGAKVRVALLSTLAAWLLVGAAIPLTLNLSDTWPVVIDRARGLADVIGTPRTAVLALLTLGMLVAATWKRLVLSMYIGLSGRPWLVRTHLGVNLAILAVVLPVFDWMVGDRDVLVALWNAAPWIAGGLAGLKVAAAGWVTARLDEARLVDRRILIGGAACWLVGVTGLYALLSWMAATPLIPHYGLMLIAILAVPLARLYAAPLALAWNRHR